MKRIYILILLFSFIALVSACAKKGPATITGNKEVTVRLGDPDFDPLAGIVATDEVKGDVLDKVEQEGVVDVNKEGTYSVTFSIKASNGEIFALTRTFEVVAIKMTSPEETKIAWGTESYNPWTGVVVEDPIDGRLRLGGRDANPNVPESQLEVKITFNGETVEAIDTKEVGEYLLAYTLTYKKVTITGTRTVKVVDEIMILGAGDKKVEVNSSFLPMLGVSAIQPVENEEGVRTIKDLTAFVRILNLEDLKLNQLNEYDLIYRIEDPASLIDPENPDAPIDHENLDPNREIVYLKQKNGELVEHIRKITVFNDVKILGATSLSLTVGSSFDPKEGVTARDSYGSLRASDIKVEGTVDTSTVGEYKLTYKIVGTFNVEYEIIRVVNVVPPLTGTQKIYFMAGDVKEYDPFHADYSGRNQKEMQDLQLAAEEKHNVKIYYVPYPDNAAWGPARVNAMIQAQINGKPLADVYYHISSDWIPSLVNGGAIGAVDEFLEPGAIGENINPTVRQASQYARKTYGFSAGGLSIESGFYYNSDLAAGIGLENPTDMYLDGRWTWDNFYNWAVQARAALKSGEYVLGGSLTYYAENLVPLNGGEFINEERQQVLFNRAEALEAYNYIKKLYDAQLFEPNRAYDAGSVEWKSGKVLFHPGHFWFLGASNRWGGEGDKKALNFKLGFVPFPMNDEYKANGGEYRSPVYGPSFPVMAGGLTQQKKELVFNVWYDLQRWVSKEQGEREFKNILKERLEGDNYVDAYLQVYDKAYRSILTSLIGRYSTGSYSGAINTGIPQGTFQTLLRESQPAYEAELKKYLEA